MDPPSSETLYGFSAAVIAGVLAWLKALHKRHEDRIDALESRMMHADVTHATREDVRELREEMRTGHKGITDRLDRMVDHSKHD